jgi:hypothetical protein
MARGHHAAGLASEVAVGSKKKEAGTSAHKTVGAVFGSITEKLLDR